MALFTYLLTKEYVMYFEDPVLRDLYINAKLPARKILKQLAKKEPILTSQLIQTTLTVGMYLGRLIEHLKDNPMLIVETKKDINIDLRKIEALIEIASK